MLKLAPRCIQSGTSHHNVITGPYCKSFSKHLAKVWSIKNALGLMYATATSAEKIGQSYKEATDRLEGVLAVLEGDFIRFDSTIHQRFLELEAWIYQHCGAPEQAVHAFLASIDTYGRDKWNTKYKAKGGRHSGDHNTSCGNTLIQGLAILYCVAFHHHSLFPDEPFPKVSQIIHVYHISLFLLGDDNLLIGNEALLADIPLKDYLIKLGLELDPKLHLGPNAKFLATFCSSRFYPVDDTFILGPGIGRGIAKSGWYVNPPPNKPISSLLRSDSIGRMSDCSFIPFLSAMWKRNHQLTQGSSVYQTREMQRIFQFNAHTEKTHTATAETYKMVEAVYGLTVTNLAEYVCMLQRVKTLPCIVDYEPLQRAMIIDGVLGTPSDVPDVSHVMPSANSIVFDSTMQSSYLPKHFVEMSSLPTKLMPPSACSTATLPLESIVHLELVV